jgi:hypothetical protein
MAVPWWRLLTIGIGLGLVAGPRIATANPECPVLEIGFQVAAPSDPANRFQPQIVGWLEDANGTFVDTVYITRQTGTFGLGNRPGRMDFNSGPFWPYGRRITVFPVWSTKQPMRWPELVFQDGDDDDLSHSGAKSSPDSNFCRPLKPDEFDVVSCPSSRAFTDKGELSPTQTSRYPPRDDLELLPQDHPSVDMFAMLNPFDAVSQPTPFTGLATHISYAIPATLPRGEYVLWLEVSKEFDMNATYNATSYPSPTGISWMDYGLPYRGQPSVLYRVPFTFSAGETVGSTDTYAGYGDPDGLDGNVRTPDSTISNEPGSGAGRLALVSEGDELYRVRVVSRTEIDVTPPLEPRSARVDELTPNRAIIRFLAPGDDGVNGKVQSYEIRYRVSEPMTEDNFATGKLVTDVVAPEVAGNEQTVTLEGLLPETTYSIGIRAFDNCRNGSSLTIVEVATPPRPLGEVDACFVATAAYGSMMADDVELLRRFRDSLLSKTVFGELAIEAYYTFGPAFAGVVGESDLLRATARGVLHPFVTWVKNYRF